MKNLLSFLVVLVMVTLTSACSKEPKSGPDAIIPSGTDNTILQYAGSVNNGLNSMVYHLNLSSIQGLDNSPVYVAVSYPGFSWQEFTPTQTIVTISGVKYLEWPVTCANGNIRIGWYQIRNGAKFWAATGNSIYYNNGLPEFRVENGQTVKLGATTNTYTINVNGVPIESGATFNVVPGVSNEFKVIDGSGNAVISNFDLGNGTVENGVLSSKSVFAAGTYKVTIVTNGKTLTLNVVSTAPVYTLKVNGATTASGATVNGTVGSATTLQVVDANNTPITATVDFGNGTSVTNTLASINYPAGDYNAKVTVPGGVFLVSFHITTTSQTYTLKINGVTTASGTTFNAVAGTTVAFQVFDANGNSQTTAFDLGNGMIATSNSASTTYTVGNYTAKATIGTTVFTVTISVSSTSLTPYKVKVAGAILTGNSVSLVEGVSTSFQVVDASGNALPANFNFGNGVITNNVSIATLSFLAGSYTANITVNGQAITLNISVSRQSYTLKVNGVAAADGATININTGTANTLQLFDASGNAVNANFDLGNGSTSSGISAVANYSNAGNYTAKVTAGSTTTSVIFHVTLLPVYTFKVNGVVTSSGSTVDVIAGSSVLFQILDVNGVAQNATFESGNGNTVTGSSSNAVYSLGNYTAKATIGTTVFTVTIRASSASLTPYTLKMNGLTVTGNSVSIVEGAVTTFQLTDASGNPVVSNFDFGNGTIANSVLTPSIIYVSGAYVFKASANGQTLTLNVTVSKQIITPSTESIILISSTVSNGLISAVFGLRCSDINAVSLSKKSYVAGEIPNTTWTNYELSEIMSINGINYYKWTVTAAPGKFRMSWVQMKDGGTDLYKDGTWAYNTNSSYFVSNTNESLYYFWTKINTNDNTVYISNKP